VKLLLSRTAVFAANKQHGMSVGSEQPMIPAVPAVM
jgi:hypothetical protein